MDDIYQSIARALGPLSHMGAFGYAVLTVRFGGFNDVVLGTTQTRGKAVLQLTDALLILRGFRQHRKFPRLAMRTISATPTTDFLEAHTG